MWPFLLLPSCPTVQVLCKSWPHLPHHATHSTDSTLRSENVLTCVTSNIMRMTLQTLPPIKWSDPDEEGLVGWLCGEKGFSEQRVRAAVGRIKAAKGKAAQGRIENFFKPAPSANKPAAPKPKVCVHLCICGHGAVVD